LPGLRNGIKHVPERTCIACRAKRPKRELIRVVRTPEGDVEVDRGGKKAGRGTYLCRNEVCWKAGPGNRRLANALRTQISSEQQAKLLAELASLLDPGVPGRGCRE